MDSGGEGFTNNTLVSIHKNNFSIIYLLPQLLRNSYDYDQLSISGSLLTQHRPQKPQSTHQFHLKPFNYKSQFNIIIVQSFNSQNQYPQEQYAYVFTQNRI